MVKSVGAPAPGIAAYTSGGWDEQKVALLAKTVSAGGADVFSTEDVGYLKALVQDPQATFSGAAKEKLLSLLVEQLKVDPSELGLAKEPVFLTFQQGNSNKFYRLEMTGETQLSIGYGKIGTKGQTLVKDFPTAKAAVAEFEKRRAEKLGEGYVASTGSVPDAATDEYPKIKTMADWKKLPAEKQAEVLEDMDYWPERYPQIKSTGDVAIDELKKPEYKTFAKKIKDEIGSLETDDDVHATVGDTRITVAIYTLPSGEILGAKIDYYQEGCDNDERGGHYDTEAEAKKDGGEFSDVNWQAHGLYNHDLEPLKDPPYYLEWSGY